MAGVTKVYANLYRDSVSLMQLSARLSAMSGIDQASAVMATPANLALLADAGLLDATPEAGPNDLIVAVSGAEGALSAALDEADAAFSGARPKVGSWEDSPERARPRSLAMAVETDPDINLALISVPGDYAAAEARKALDLGLNVMLFSDNVPAADEIALKTRARDKGLIVMGPDCGTAIIDGVPLGFANVVRHGAIGVVAASGTGLQQVTCLVDRAGAGVSHALGTGGHDLSADVGGITMLRGISSLGADDGTRVIVLVSKPPAPEIAEKVLAHAAAAGKPVVVNFLGADAGALRRPGVTVAVTLADAAAMAVALAGGAAPGSGGGGETALPEDLPAPAAGRRYIRGLYSGGTFCYEALVLLSDAIGPVHSNTPIAPEFGLADPWRSQEHTVIDLGDDLFTRGRPHPMIDQRLRNARIVQEAQDPATAVILFDVVLGYGAHADPAPEIAAAIREAGVDGPVYVASVCGTAGDPQGLARQEEILRDAGVVLADSNARAVRLAAAIAIEAGV